MRNEEERRRIGNRKIDRQWSKCYRWKVEYYLCLCMIHTTLSESERRTMHQSLSSATLLSSF